MQFLLWVTLIWSFSFSLIGEFLAGRVDPYLAVASRMALALLLFLPLLWRYPTPPPASAGALWDRCRATGPDVPAVLSQLFVSDRGRGAAVYHFNACVCGSAGSAVATPAAKLCLAGTGAAGRAWRFCHSLR